MSLIEEDEGMEVEDVIEAEDVKNLDVQLDEKSALNLMGLMDSFGISDVGETVRELIRRAHLREENSREWKSRIADRRRLLKKQVKEIDEKLEKIDDKSMAVRFFLKYKKSKLKKKKRLLEERLKEQLRTYRVVDKIE